LYGKAHSGLSIPFRIDLDLKQGGFPTAHLQSPRASGRQYILNVPGEPQSLAPSSMVVFQFLPDFVVVRVAIMDVKKISRHHLELRFFAAGL
jgi:hypothetical protein